MSTTTTETAAHYYGTIRELHGPCTILGPCDLYGERDRFVVRTHTGEEISNVRLRSLRIDRTDSTIDHFVTHDGYVHHRTCPTTAPMGAAITSRQTMIALYNHDATPCPACIQF